MANLTGKGFFQPGNKQSPGRPSFKDLILKVGSEQATSGITKSELLVRTAFNMATDPESPHAMQAIKWIADRADGSIQQQLDVTTLGERLNSEKLTDEEIANRVAAILNASATAETEPGD